KHKVEIGLLCAASFFPSTVRSHEHPSEKQPLTPASSTVDISLSENSLPRLDSLQFTKILDQHSQSRFDQLSISDQVKFCTIYEALPSSAKEHLLKILNKTVRDDVQVALLDTDFMGSSTLDNLNRLIDCELHPLLDCDRDSILESLLLE